jgi:hypothetical protein
MDVATRGMLVGMALGGGHVRVRKRLNNGKYPFEERVLRVLHSTNQRAYCEFKAGLIEKAFGRRVSVTTVKNGPGGRYSAAQFTFSHPYCGQLRQWCYPGGRKTFTRKTLEMLTPLGLAIWYMDDGHARRGYTAGTWVTSCSTDIATMCSEGEALTIKDWFKDEYGIAFNVRFDKRCNDGSQYFVQANTAASREFVGVIRPHIPECMLYKISHVADLSSHECRASSSRTMR